MNDGAIIISTKLDNTELEKQLSDLKAKIASTEAEAKQQQKKVADAQKKYNAAVSTSDKQQEKASQALKARDDFSIEHIGYDERLQGLDAALENARKKVMDYNEAWKNGVAGADRDEAKARDEVAALREEYDKELETVQKIDAQMQALSERAKALYQDYEANNQATAAAGTELEKEKAKLEEINQQLKTQEIHAGEVVEQLEAANGGGGRMGEAIDKAGARLERFTNRVKGLARRVFVFTLITKALRLMRDWLGKVLETNHEATTAMSRLKGALLTLVQPLLSVVIPAFIMLVNLLTRLASVAAQVLARLFGKTAGESKKSAAALYQEAKALDAAGGAADKAGEALAGFDDLNVLQQPEEISGGGGAAAAPSFDVPVDMDEERLQNILGLVKAVAAGLLAWKLSSSFGGGLKTFVGLMLAMDGAVGLVKTTMDAWANGVTWETLGGMLGRTTELVVGLWLAFGKTGAGIGLLVSGLVMLVTAFHDAYENGWNLQNLLLAVAGILAAGLGLAVLTGSWIPLLIAGLAALLVSLVAVFGDGDALVQGFMDILGGFKDFFVGLFTGDLAKASEGLGQIFEGIGTVFRSVIDAVKNMFLSFLTWLDGKTNGKFHGIIQFAIGLVTGFFDTVRRVVGIAVDTIKNVFQGLLTFFTGVFTGDWDMAWQGVKDIFKSIWNGIVALLETAVNLIIKGINWLIEKLNSIQFELPEWVPGVGGKSFGINIPKVKKVEIPRLARGAVIPPNREFLAVLGDQKNGTNIEAPLDTIRQALAEVLAEQRPAGRSGDVVLQIDGKTFARLIGPYNNQESRRKGVKLVIGGV